MTSFTDHPEKPLSRTKSGASAGHWRLQDAKARFSELVRRVHKEGPQRVSTHGRDEVVVVSAAEFERLQSQAPGTALIDAMQASPYRDVELTAPSSRAPVRDVSL